MLLYQGFPFLQDIPSTLFIYFADATSEWLASVKIFNGMVNREYDPLHFYRWQLRQSRSTMLQAQKARESHVSLTMPTNALVPGILASLYLEQWLPCTRFVKSPCRQRGIKSDKTTMQGSVSPWWKHPSAMRWKYLQQNLNSDCKSSTVKKLGDKNYF